MIAGLLAALGGRDPPRRPPVAGPQTDIGIVFQSHVLVDWRDVLGNVLLQIDLRGLPRAAYLDRALASCCARSGSRASPAAGPTSSRAACSSGRPSAARWSTTRRWS